MAITNYLAQAALRAPNRVAVDLVDRAYTYGELWSHACRWALQIRTRGIMPGDTVLVCATEVFDLLGAEFGAWLVDCTVVPWQPQSPVAELRSALASSDAHGLIAPPSILKALAPEMPRSLIWLPDQVKVSAAPESIVSDASNPIALLLFTSGTTGGSKCVTFSHAAMMANVDALAGLLGLGASDRLMTPVAPELPATLATCILPSFAAECTVSLVKHALPARLITLLRQQAVSVLFAVPYIYDLLCRSNGAGQLGQLERLRLCLTSSAPLQQELFYRFQSLSGRLLRSIYCSSEAGTITYNNSDDLACCAESVGRPIPGVTLRICAEDGTDVPSGMEGEVVVSGPMIASGYFKRPEVERLVFRNGGVFTGDIGRVDDKGYLYLSGRRSDTINVAGYLVSPQDVEAVIEQHPLVSDVFVYGEPDPMLGEVVVARVLTRGPVTADQLLAYCRTQLLHYKVPHRIHFVDHLTMTDLGKKIRG